MPPHNIPSFNFLYSFKLSVGKVGFANIDLFTNEAIFSVLPNENYCLNYFYYSLPIYVLVDSQYLTPSDSVYDKLKEFFKTIKLKEGGLVEDKFQVIDPKLVKLYRVVQAYKFYFNSKINRKNINILTDLIKHSFDKYSLGNFTA